MHSGKDCNSEMDGDVPLVVRVPGTAKDQITAIVTIHTNLAPTFLRWSVERLEVTSNDCVVRLHAIAIEL